MGYYTYYDVDVKDLEGNPIPAESTKIMAATLNTINPNEFDVDMVEFGLNNMVGCDERKWYNCKDDMVELSKIFSDKQFVVTGWGEDRNDVWRMKITNGKSVWSHGQIWFPGLDEEL